MCCRIFCRRAELSGGRTCARVVTVICTPPVECRVLEDALCLMFLEFQFTALAAKSDDEKMVNALRKSWEKMTEAARTEALKLSFGAREKNLIGRALNA